MNNINHSETRLETLQKIEDRIGQTLATLGTLFADGEIPNINFELLDEAYQLSIRLERLEMDDINKGKEE